MPIIPNASTPIDTSLDPDQAIPINKTLAVAGTAEDLVLVPVSKTGRKFSIVNDGPGLAYFAVDGTATTSGIEVKKDEPWYEDNVKISTKISFIGQPGKMPHVRGVLWVGAEG